MKFYKYSLIALIFCFASSAMAMRCGSSIVDTGQTKYQVTSRCGEPTAVDINSTQSANYPYTTTTTETWTYDRTSDGGLVYTLTFLNGRLTDIENTQ